MCSEIKKNPVIFFGLAVLVIYLLIPKKVVVVSKFGRDVVYFKK